MRIVQPEGWPRPRGYANGIVAEGRVLFISGQVAWDENGELVALDDPLCPPAVREALLANNG